MTAKSPSRHSVLCPVCRAEGLVVDSRRHGDARVRRRKCNAEGCGAVWLTTEGEPSPPPTKRVWVITTTAQVRRMYEVSAPTETDAEAIVANDCGAHFYEEDISEEIDEVEEKPEAVS